MNEISEIRPITDQEAAGLVSPHACDELMEMIISVPVCEGARHGRRRFAGKPNRRPLLVGGGVAGLAAVMAAAVLIATAATSAPPAYALTQNPDGTVTVTINELATAIPQLNAKFAQMGIEETVVPVTTNCSSSVPLDIDPTGKTTDTVTLTAGGKWLAPGYTGVLAAEQLANGQIAMFVGALKPPVPSCFSATTALGAPHTGANGIPTITTETVTPAG